MVSTNLFSVEIDDIKILNRHNKKPQCKESHRSLSAKTDET